MKRYAYTTGDLGAVQSTKTYTYSTGSWKDLLVNYNGKAITYDGMGNMATYDGKTYTWQGRELAQIQGGGNIYTYKYNANGIRTSKTVNGTTTEYFLNGTQILAQKTGDTVMWFFYDSQGQRIGLVYNDYVYYYVYNLQGDVIALARAATGEIVARYAYDAWGNCTVTNATSYDIGTRNPFRYRGYYYDAETGMYYLNSRYYSPEFGRFISPDVFVSTGQGLVGSNMFAYCGNNPVMYWDPYGSRYCADISLDKETPYDRFISCDYQKIVTLERTGKVVDLTARLNAFMEDNLATLMNYKDSYGYVNACLLFYKNVDDGEYLDIKLQDEWKFSEGVTSYYYYGIKLRYDDPGNINFGFIGAALFCRPILCAGAGINQLTKPDVPHGDIFTFFDDPRDNYMIKFGYALYLRRHG